MSIDAGLATESLVWETEMDFNTGAQSAYFAHLPWRRGEFLASPYYRVYSWKGGWSFRRDQHPELPPLSGVAKTLKKAKTLCEEDFAVVARLHRWHLHMISHEPPSVK